MIHCQRKSLLPLLLVSSILVIVGIFYLYAITMTSFLCGLLPFLAGINVIFVSMLNENNSNNDLFTFALVLSTNAMEIRVANPTDLVVYEN